MAVVHGDAGYGSEDAGSPASGPRYRVQRRRRVGMVPLGVVMVAAWTAAIAAAYVLAIGVAGALRAPAAQVLSGGRYGFDPADGIAFGGGHAWVVNQDGNSVTEVNAADGSWVQTLSGGRYGFDHPSEVVAVGQVVWVSNSSSLTELNAVTGAWIRTLSGHGLDAGAGLAADGSRLWVFGASPATGTGLLVELNAVDGSWVRTVQEKTGISGGGPWAMAVDGPHIWVLNGSSTDTGGSVTELNAGDGSPARIVSGRRYRFENPSGLAVDGGHVWVTSYNGGSNDGWVTEIDASSGSLVRILSGGHYGFNVPDAIAADGPHLWVVNGYDLQDGGSVTEFDSSDGRWIQTLSSRNLFHTLLSNGIHDLLRGSYGFSNPLAIVNIQASGAWCRPADGFDLLTQGRL